MAESVCRSLRDGVVEGEYAPAVLLLDSLSVTGGPAVFGHFVQSLSANIWSEKAQAKGLVFVAVDQRPECYQAFLQLAKPQTNGWLQVIDCFSDPLGWEKAIEHKQCQQADEKVKQGHVLGLNWKIYREIEDMETLMLSILESGQSAVGSDNKGHFSVIIDSVSTLLRHNSFQSIARFLSNLRSHGQVSSLLWMLHGDLHETKVVHALEYSSSTVVFVESLPSLVSTGDVLWRGEIRRDVQAEDFTRGVIRVRQKRRNGRVREQIDQFQVERLEAKFSPLQERTVVVTGKSSVPQVPFNLELTDKEREDRAKVVLPFEHQGNGKEVHIYDGRSEYKSVDHGISTINVSEVHDDKMYKSHGMGQIHYFRDSDDERPDSDEDPDDDLDI